MAFWSKKKLSDVLSKYFKEKKITLSENNNMMTFELSMNSGYSLFPYFKINDDSDSLAIVINIRQVTKADSDLYKSLNAFNLKSKYFTAKLSEDLVIYLEYNSICNSDNVCDIFENIMLSVSALDVEIDSI